MYDYITNFKLSEKNPAEMERMKYQEPIKYFEEMQEYPERLR